MPNGAHSNRLCVGKEDHQIVEAKKKHWKHFGLLIHFPPLQATG
jgi:hypothetical protein